MPLELQIIRAGEFVRLGARDHLSLEASREALVDLVRACRKRGVDSALLDLRELAIPARPLFTPTELASLVGTFHQEGFGQNQRLAVLYRSDPHHGARHLAFVSSMKGWQVRAFGEFEDALNWLSEAEPTQLASRELSVPIHVANRKVEVKGRRARATK
jgi:hypothetical protein